MDDLIDIDELDSDDVIKLLQTARQIKQEPSGFTTALEDRTLLMLFAKPSTRTRVSFEAGMTRLGGHAINFEMGQSQMSRGESLRDTAEVLSRYTDAIMARLYDHEDLRQLREHATVPVINGLTDLLHPCQAISDLFTIHEQGRNFRQSKLAFVGDGNNMAHSLMQACAAVGMDCTVATPEGYGPDETVLGRARARGNRNGARIRATTDQQQAVADADVVYTDVWASMGDDDTEERKQDLGPYQVDQELLSGAADDAVFMHCLPAHRGQEVTADVIDGPHSIVYDQAENRMHVQEAILTELV